MQFSSEDELRAAIGTHLGHSEWLEIDQPQVDGFADLTRDHQWIHVDPERAAAESPYGGTVAHGLLGLSLVPYLTEPLLDVQKIDVGLNYGFNRVRFPSPLLVGARVRAGATLAAVAESRNGVLVTLDVVIEAEGQDRPVAVIEWLLLLRFSNTP